MRIAQVAPLTESVPPQLYGGTERVVAFLTDELVRLGHDVTLFASGDSHTSATAGRRRGRGRLRLGGACRTTLAPHLLMLEEVAKRAQDFDVIHFHIAQFHFPVARRLPVAHVTTLHGRLDLPELPPLYREFCDIPARLDLRRAARRRCPTPAGSAPCITACRCDLLPFHPAPGEYLAFLGRISPEKRVDRAIAIATACGQPLRIAAKVDPADRDYFEREIRPLLDHPLVEFIGEIGEEQKGDFLGGATRAALSDRLARAVRPGHDRGAGVRRARRRVSRRIGPGGRSITASPGSSSTRIEEAIEATRAGRPSEPRGSAAPSFERRFSVTRMAADYVQLYETLARAAGVPIVAMATGAA